MQFLTRIFLVGVIVFPSSILLAAKPVIAGGGVSDTPQATGNIVNPNSVVTEVNNPITQVNQQSGIVQVANWNGSSNLAPPACTGGCFFAVTRVTPTTYGSGHNTEALIGITLPIGSNDNGIGEVNRINAEMQKYRTENDAKLALSEKLSEALENCKTERAKIIALLLAPMLGYKDYQALLATVSKPNHNQICESKSAPLAAIPNPNAENNGKNIQPPAQPK
jgi:hypothetical protein